MKVEDLIKTFGEKYNAQIKFVTCEAYILYNEYYGNDSKARLAKTPEEIYKEKSKQEIPEHIRYLALQIDGEDLNQEETSVITPRVKYYFR